MIFCPAAVDDSRCRDGGGGPLAIPAAPDPSARSTAWTPFNASASGAQAGAAALLCTADPGPGSQIPN